MPHSPCRLRQEVLLGLCRQPLSGLLDLILRGCWAAPSLPCLLCVGSVSLARHPSVCAAYHPACTCVCPGVCPAACGLFVSSGPNTVLCTGGGGGWACVGCARHTGMALLGAGCSEWAVGIEISGSARAREAQGVAGPRAPTAVPVASPSSDTACARVWPSLVRLHLAPLSCSSCDAILPGTGMHGHTNANGTVCLLCATCPLAGHQKPLWGVLRRKEASALPCQSAQSCFTFLRKGFWSHLHFNSNLLLLPLSLLFPHLAPHPVCVCPHPSSLTRC